MRSLGLWLLSLLLGLGLAVAVAPAGQAVDPLTGRIRAADTGAGVPGLTVRLRRVGEGGPGSVVATATTAADGSFALDAGVAPDDEYYVQVVPGRYQGGYVGGGFVQPTDGDATTFGPHDALGAIGANPAFVRGVLLDATTRRPVRGVRVSGGTHGEAPVDQDVTDQLGRFEITGFTCEDDCFVRFRGRPRGYENGLWGCGGRVVPTWGDACAVTLGQLGKVRIDPL